MPEIKHHGSLSPEFALLGFLYEQPSYGYDLHQRLVNELGFVWHISQSQAYTILNRLEAHGDISSTILEQEKLPSRQILKITPKGRKRFQEWLHTPICGSVHVIRLEFITQLYFTRKYAPINLKSLLDLQFAEINTTIHNLELNITELPADQIFNRLSLQLRIKQLSSVLDWLNECLAALV
jgi:DNA-binding PadR family transcriptional regulator